MFMEKKNCVIWGIGNIGSSSILKDMISTRYKVIAYCDNNVRNKTEVNNLHTILANDITEYIKKNSVSVIWIAVRNRDAMKSIYRQIEHLRDVRVFDLYSAELDEIENEYLAEKSRRLQFKYQVDFDKHSRIWVENLTSEIVYWIERYAETDGAFINAYIQNKHFLTYFPEYKEFSSRLCDGDTVLDMGSGIVSKFGCFTPEGRELHVHAVDPLAYYYNQLLPKDVPRARKCKFGLFELIANFYDVESVDGIMINNALDHCIDPFKSIVECLYILKKGGYICTLHRRAEAVYEKYTGLHRWNVDYDSKDHLIIWNENNAIDVTKALGKVADIVLSHSDEKTTPREKQMVKVEIKKKQCFQLEQFIDLQRERKSMANLIKCLMEYFAETDNIDIYQRLHAL